ncbi:glycosyltransferase family 39 protein [Planctomicrobium sp.]|nr:glycosyltransferase family 39 protein [Planctomicrobium sp.]MDB4733007.1 glycosyltransferase family 39 protein [Planctomicrobium sp.]
MNWNQEQQADRITKAAHALEKQTRFEQAGGDPTINFFGAFLVGHVLIWTFLAAMTQPNLPSETLSLLTAGQSPAWGYFDQPPLAVWLMSFISAIFAPAAWPAYFLAQVCIATCMWAAWKIGKDFLQPWTAICGAVVLEGCYFFTIGSTAFTSAHLAGCFWALAILALYHGFQLEQRRYWVIVGVCLGLGMLSHYSTALLFVSMLAFSFLNRQARSCWDTSWPFLAGSIAAAIMLPHFWWAWSHDFTTFSTSMQGIWSVSSHGEESLKFVVSQLFAVVPVLLLLIPIISYFRLDEPTTSEDEEKDFVRQYLVVVTALPAALMLAFALLGGVHLGSTGLTLWTFVGVVLLLWSDLDENRIAWRKVILHSGAIGGAFAALLVVMNFMIPYAMNPKGPDDIHFPGKELAHEVQRIWKAQGHEQELAIVAGPNQLAQNTSWYYGKWSRPMAYNNLDKDQSVGVTDEKLREKGGIILWTEELTPEQENELTAETELVGLYSFENLAGRFSLEEQPGNLQILAEPIALKWGKSTKNEPLLVRVAIIHPWGTTHSEIIPEQLPVIEVNPEDEILPLQFGQPAQTGISLRSDTQNTNTYGQNQPPQQSQQPILNAAQFESLILPKPATPAPATRNVSQPFPIQRTVSSPPTLQSQPAPFEEEDEVVPSFLAPAAGVQPVNFSR